jgi:hypothetical protein
MQTSLNMGNEKQCDNLFPFTKYIQHVKKKNYIHFISSSITSTIPKMNFVKQTSEQMFRDNK